MHVYDYLGMTHLLKKKKQTYQHFSENKILPGIARIDIAKIFLGFMVTNVEFLLLHSCLKLKL